jgi:uncharacterized LabA/DUF88 family protein
MVHSQDGLDVPLATALSDDSAVVALDETHFPAEYLSMLKPTLRVMLFIDGASTFQASRALSFDIDFKNLWAFFADRCEVVRAYYVTLMPEMNPHDNSYNVLRPLVDWLGYNQYTVIQKPVKYLTDPQKMRPQTKGTVDVELAVLAMQQLPYYDVAVLFSGDGDFCALVNAIKTAGRRVMVVSALEANPAILSDELRRSADLFVNINDLRPYIERRSQGRRQRRVEYSKIAGDGDHG